MIFLDSVEPVNYDRVVRSDQSYTEIAEYVELEITRLVQMYHDETRLQTCRLIRDSIDHHLRRYHNYAIKERIGSHYKQVGLTENGIFEHMIPNSTVRDLLISGHFTVRQACNVPTCKISVDNDRLLRKAGYTSTTPSIYNFWRRYEVCNGSFVDNFNNPVNFDMTLEDHYKIFKDY
jgi:hypothetical protein